MSDAEKNTEEDVLEEAPADDFDVDEMYADNEILGAFNNDEDEEGEEGEGEGSEGEGSEGEEEKGEEGEGETGEDEGEEKEGETDDALQGKEEGEEEGEKEVDDKIEVDEDGALVLPETAKVRLKIDGEEVVKPIGEVIASAQKAESATQKWQEAAEFQKRSLHVINKLKEDPLAVAYHLLVEDIGDDKAYQRVLDNATALVGKELEFQKLPAEERERRRSETAIAARDREIERLKNVREEESRSSKGRILANQIIAGAISSGIATNPKDALDNHKAELSDIAKIYDFAAARGNPITVDDAIKEYHKTTSTRLDRKLKDLSDDDLRRLGLKRAKESASSKPGIGKVRRGQSQSRDKPRPKGQKKKPPKIFADFDEARRWSK